MTIQTTPISEIQVVALAEGFKVYAAFGAVMVADKNKDVTYSNMVKGSIPYMKMKAALKDFKA
jgi:hypothetical protein